MKKAELQAMYGTTPEGFRSAVKSGLNLARAQQNTKGRPIRVFALAAAALMLAMGAAYAAFPSQVAAWFGKMYGEKTEQWLKQGKADAKAQTLTVGGAVFTLEETVQRNRGLYCVGTVTLPENSRDVLVAEDQSVNEPFGYDVHGMGGTPQKAPEGTPTLKEKAKAQGGRLLLAVVRLEAVGVDGGEKLEPDSVGYGVFPMPDGSLRFMVETEDGIAVGEGETYQLSIRASVRELNEEGAVKENSKIEKMWEAEVAPGPIEQ